MESLRNKEVILWDFDGVIIDSLSIRENGFIDVLSNYPIDKVDLLLKFHKENGGLSRYVKFEYFFTEILKIKVQDEVLKEYLLKFSTIMRKSLVYEKLLIDDVTTFISKNQDKFKMHIVSGSDENELKYLCEKLKLSQYFKSIHGSPIPKKILVKELIEKENYNCERVCLIGDSINDYHAAKSNNIEFYGYNSAVLKETGYNYINYFS